MGSRNTTLNSQLSTLNFFLYLLAGSLPLSIAASHVLLGVLLLLWGYQWARGKRLLIRTPLDGPILIYLTVVLTGALVGESPSRSLINLIALWHIAIYLIVANGVTTRTLALRLILVLLGVSALNALYGMAQHLLGGLDLSPFYGNKKFGVTEGMVRAEGLFDHYMTFAGQMLLASLFATGLLFIWARGWVFLGLGLAVVFLLGGVLASLTRNAYLGVMAGLLAMALCKDWKTFSLITTGLILALLTLFLFYPSFQERVMSIVHFKRDESSLERIRTWRATLDMIQDRRLLGVGIGNYETVLIRYKDRYGAGRHSHAHNTLLQETAQNGLIGLFAYLAIWYVFFREAIRTAKKTTDPFTRGISVGSMGALVGFHVAGLFEYNLGDSEVAMMMWFIVGLAMAAHVSCLEVKG